MWNHLFQFQTDQDSGGISEATVVPANGSPVLQALVRATNSNPFFKPDFSGTFKPSDIFWRIRTQDIGPARKAGGGTLLLDAVDQINFGRRAFSYIPGQRRVKLAPDLSYDTPTPYTGGSSTMDDAMGGFMGALDRFEFTLVGRKEMYIPYNMFALSDRKSCPMEKLTATKNFPNPECVRFELHRVWHVKAKLKAGFRHIYKTREFFWDEDAPAAGMAFAYDATGALYRATWSISFPYYEAPGGVGGMFGNAQLGSDVITGNWYVIGGGNCREKNCGWTVTPAKGETFWSPEAMASEGIR